MLLHAGLGIGLGILLSLAFLKGVEGRSSEEAAALATVLICATFALIGYFLADFISLTPNTFEKVALFLFAPIPVAVYLRLRKRELSWRTVVAIALACFVAYATVTVAYGIGYYAKQVAHQILTVIQ